MTYLSRRHLMAAGLGLGIAGVTGQSAAARPLIALPNDIVQSDAATVTAVRTPSPVVAMTFDDGPHPTHTPRLLDMLRERGLRATFYLIGNRVVQYPQIARRIAEEGHEIGNHSWSHPFMNRLGDRQVIQEIDQTTDAIFQVTGRPPVTFRPPYGAFTRQQRTWLNEVRRLPTILWSVDPQDWRRPGASVVANRILQASHQGDRLGQRNKFLVVADGQFETAMGPIPSAPRLFRGVDLVPARGHEIPPNMPRAIQRRAS